MLDQSEPKTLLGALQEATKHGILYSQYNWVKEDIERMEGKQKKEKEKKEDPPKEKRNRGERKVSRVLKVLTGALEQDNIILKANGHLIKTLSEQNLDHNGVSFSAAVTRNIYTPGNRTLEVHFFSNSRTTIFKKEPINMEDKIWTLLKERKTKEDAKNEIIEKIKMRNAKEGDEKEEKSEDFYMSADNANTREKATVWKRCNLCYYMASRRWEINESIMQRHFKRYHEESMKMDLLELNKEQSHETKNRNTEMIKQLTPVVKIQHLEPEDKREKKHRVRNTGKKFKCEHCDFLTTWDASLKKHSHINSGEKYMCKKCGFMTTWNVSLRVHSRIHSDEEIRIETMWPTVSLKNQKEKKSTDAPRRNKCAQSKQDNEQERNIKEHFLCNICDLTFLTVVNLKKHKKMHNVTEQQYSCKLCAFSAGKAVNLEAHLLVRHAL